MEVRMGLHFLATCFVWCPTLCQALCWHGARADHVWVLSAAPSGKDQYLIGLKGPETTEPNTD